MLNSKYIKVSTGLPIQGSQLTKSGQVTRNLVNDDGDTERGMGASFFNLGFNNAFGNTNRFTDTLGTQAYANDIVLDHSTRDTYSNTILCYYRVMLGKSTMISALSLAPYTLESYSGWHVTNIREMSNIFNHEISLLNWLNYAPFNYDVSVDGPVWINTKGRNLATDSLVLSSTGVHSTINTQACYYMVARYFNLGELGI